MEPELEPFNTHVAEAHHVRQLLTWLVRCLHGLLQANCPLGKDLTVPESSNATTANSGLFLQLARPFSSLAPLFIPKWLWRTGMLWRRENPRVEEHGFQKILAHVEDLRTVSGTEHLGSIP